MPATSYNTASTETAVSTRLRRSISPFDATNSQILLTAPVTPTKTTTCYHATLPPPIPIKRQIYAMVEDNEMPFPVFPSLGDDVTGDDCLYHLSFPSPQALMSDYDDMDVMFCTPSKSERSPLSVEQFVIPRVGLKPRRASQDTHQVTTIGDEQNLPPPYLPSLIPQDDPIDCSTTTPLRIALRPSRLPFTPVQLTVV